MNRINYIDYKPQYFEEENYHFKVGNGWFDDDIWDFNGLEGVNRITDKCNNKIDFTFINRYDMKLVSKQYALKRLIKVRPNSLNRNFKGLKHFIVFLEQEYPMIKSFEYVSRMILRSYFDRVIKSKNIKGLPISRTDIFHRTTPVKDMLIEGDRLNWKVPNNCSNCVRSLYEEMILKSPRTKMPKEKTTKERHTEETIKQIILDALKEDNIYTKASVIIQTQTGLRISEVLSIEEGCLKYEDGGPVLEYWTRKTDKGDVLVTTYANALVWQVINELEEHTRKVRKKIKSKRLFVHSVRYDSLICEFNHPSNFNRDYIKPFIKRWNIQQYDELIELTSHYFRHYFAQGAWRKGLSITEISEMMNHDSLNMTETYTYNLREEISNRFIDILTNDEMIAGTDVANIKERLKKDNPFKGKTEKQIKLVANAMRIKVLANGICMHHPLRKEECPVEDGGCEHCSNFITHKCCLPVHKLRVKRYEDEMERAKNQGNMIWYQKNKEEKEYIENTFIIPLESQSSREREAVDSEKL